MLKHIILLFKKSLIIININCCCRYKTIVLKKTLRTIVNVWRRRKQNYLGVIMNSVTNLDKEVTGQEDALIICLSLPVKCKHYTTERKNQIIEIVFDEIMRE